MSTEERKSTDRGFSPEEMKRIMKVGAVLAISAVVFMLGLGLLIHQNIIGLHPASTREETLKGFAPRVEYALRYQSLLVFWLTFNVVATIYGRLTTNALNPLDERTEHRVQMFKNVLTNSFESVVVSVFSQLIFVSFAEPLTVLKFIPFINIVQFIGRVSFFAGYPMYRAFGFQCTILPNICLSFYNLFKLGSFMGFY